LLEKPYNSLFHTSTPFQEIKIVVNSGQELYALLTTDTMRSGPKKVVPKNAVDQQSLREQELVDFTTFVVAASSDMTTRTNKNMIEGK
jgi:hypothetical protein